MHLTALSHGTAFRRTLRLNAYPVLAGLSAVLFGFAPPVAAQPVVHPSATVLFYSLDMENTRVELDRIKKTKSKEFRIKSEGGGRAAQIVKDKAASSTVLVIRTDATPPGKIKDRSEVQLYSGVDFGKTWALGMSVFIPADVKFTDNWHLMTQCHQGGALHPPLSLNLIPPQQIAVVARNNEDGFDALHTTKMPTGRWVRIELEFNMGERGHVKFWMDDQLLFDKDATLRFKEGIDRCNLKVGTYRGKASTPHEIRFDNLRLGSSREAVTPR